MLIVFSDLDGTILDERTYSFEQSLPGLAILRERGIPLVLASSKTFDEMTVYHREFGLAAPFIFENGGGVAWPDGDGYRIDVLGMDAASLAAALPLIESSLRRKVLSIVDMTAGEVARRTGLSSDQAVKARARRSSLPFVVEGDVVTAGELDAVNGMLAMRACAVVRGKRFFHLISPGADKGAAAALIAATFRHAAPDGRIVTWAVGDSYNDVSLFAAVDCAVYVGEDGGLVDGMGHVVRSTRPGPEGFVEAVEMLTGRPQR
jgi:mannosyl-3-phosphoglycerate phosphatase